MKIFAVLSLLLLSACSGRPDFPTGEFALRDDHVFRIGETSYVARDLLRGGYGYPEQRRIFVNNFKCMTRSVVYQGPSIGEYVLKIRVTDEEDGKPICDHLLGTWKIKINSRYDIKATKEN